MRALVTGASGFLGRHLVHALEGRGVVALIRDDVLTPFEWDFSVGVRGSFDQVERAIAEYEVTHVVHLAAQTQVSIAANDPIGTLEANVRGTWQVLEACRRQKVKRVIVASSDKAIGECPQRAAEDAALHPVGIYSTSKACGDLLAQAYAREYGLSVAITRCGNLYGAGHVNWSTLIPGTIRSLLRSEPVRLRSDGHARRNFLYVRDAVDGYLKLLDASLSPGEVFHFGATKSHSVREVVEACEVAVREAGVNYASIVEYASESAPGQGGVEPIDHVLDCSKAKRVLDWEPKMTFEAGIAETVKWYREYLR
jgi:CDP-glucose 4,6-dehydratase